MTTIAEEKYSKKKTLLAKVKKVDQGVYSGDSPPEDSFTADEYAEFTNGSQGNARYRLRQLLKKGKVKVVFHGLKGRVSYALVEDTTPLADDIRRLDQAMNKTAANPCG